MQTHETIKDIEAPNHSITSLAPKGSKSSCGARALSLNLKLTIGLQLQYFLKKIPILKISSEIQGFS